MADLFNRQIYVTLRSQEPQAQGNRLVALGTFSENKIQVSLNKDIVVENSNVGSILITNFDKDIAQNSFVNIREPRNILYSVQAGYNRENVAGGAGLPLLSIGFVTYTNWSHQGGDTNLQFQISEGVKFGINRFSTLGVRSIPKGGTVMHFLGDLESSGVPIRFVPDRATVAAKIIQKGGVLDSDFVSKSSPEEVLRNLLGRSGFGFFVEDGYIVIYETSGDLDFVTPFTGRTTILNFETGLLSADTEVGIFPGLGVHVPTLKFKALFIPELRPRNYIELNEPAYPALKGRYLINNVSYSLNNKSGGDFSVTGVAFNTDFLARRDQDLARARFQGR